MNNINLSQNNYVDYVASMYFNAMGVKEVKFSPKVVKVGDEDAVLIHISGVQVTTGVVVNVDLWPRNKATEEDIAKLPKSIDDIQFRIGYWPAIDENGEQHLRQGTPKWTMYRSGDKEVVLTGEKREYEA